MIQRELINPLIAIAAFSVLALASQAKAQSAAWPPLEQPQSVAVGSSVATVSAQRRPAQRRGLFQLFGEDRAGTVQNRPMRVQRTTQPRRTVRQRVAQRPVAPRRAAAPVRRGIDPKYLPAIVSYPTSQKAGTIVIDPGSRYLYLVMEGGKAKRYGVGVGREGFGWSGTVTVARKAEWPGWTPPAEMRKRQPGLPKYMEGGPNNPLGARALYLHRNGRDTLYRIHGSNEPWTIGQAVSSGCIRMRNEDVTDLYQRVGIGTKVVVL